MVIIICFGRVALQVRGINENKGRDGLMSVLRTLLSGWSPIGVKERRKVMS